MRATLGLSAGALLCAGTLACGQSASRPASSSSSARSALITPASAPPSELDRDGDLDRNSDDQHVFGFGHAAAAGERAAITTLIDRYYAAAAAERGSSACALLTPFVAESVPERDGSYPGTRGSTCAVVMSKLFAQEHRQLVGKSAHLQVVRVGVEGNRSLVAIEFPEIPRLRQITARRSDGRWTMLTLLDGIIE